MKASHVRELILLVCAAVGAGGCASRTPLHEDGALARLWHQRLAEYNIISVLPPREDVQVGDVFLVCAPPNRMGSQWQLERGPTAPTVLPVYVATVPGATAALEKHYAARVSVPELPFAEGEEKKELPPPMVRAEKWGPFGESPNDNRRLRNVSLPEFFSVSAEGAGLRALAPTPSALVGAGFSRDSLESVVVSIPAGSSYALPAMQLLRLAREWQQVDLMQLWALSNTESGTRGCEGTSKLVLVNEVYLAHAIDVRFNYEEAAVAAARAAVSLEDDPRRKAIFDALRPSFRGASKSSESPKNGGVADAGRNSGSLTSGGLDLADPRTLAALETHLKLLDGLGEFSQPGVSASVYGGAGSGLVLRRRFANPVVIGYRGIGLELVRDAKDRITLLGSNSTSPYDVLGGSERSPSSEADGHSTMKSK